MVARSIVLLALFLGCSVSYGEQSLSIEPIKCAGHTGSVTAVAVSPDGTRAASVSAADNTLRMWDTVSGEELFKRDVFDVPAKAHRTNDVVFSPDGKLVVVASSGPVRFWEVDTGKAVDKQCKFGYGSDMAISCDGKLLALARAYSIDIWNISKCERKHKIPEGMGAVAAVAFSPDGKMLAATYWGGSIVDLAKSRVRVWDVGRGKEVFAGWKTIAHGQDVAFSPDGKFLAAVNEIGQLRMWNFESQETLYTIEAEKDFCRSVAFSSDGTILATGGNAPNIKLWDAATGKAVGELKGHTAAVGDVSFSPDGKILVSGSNDHSVMIWPMKGE